MQNICIDKLMIAGISDITNNKNEISGDTEKISPLWNRYMEENIYEKTLNKSQKKYLYGVYSEYVSDVNGDYKITVGTEVTSPEDAIIIENQKYLVFSNKSKFPDVVMDTWDQIWKYFADENSKYKRAYKVDFEKYITMDELEIHISIL